MPSFDVVNRLDFQEIDNAIANVTREITNRYDFKGSDQVGNKSYFRSTENYFILIGSLKQILTGAYLSKLMIFRQI